MAGRAPKPGQRGSRRWRKFRRRVRLIEGRHRRRIRQAQHEAAKTVITWAVRHRVGTLTVGDPRGVLGSNAGRRHNLRVRQWQVGRAIAVLRDKAELAGIAVHLADERGTSSTCPACRQRIRKPAGRTMTCTTCPVTGHRDLFAAATIATPHPAPRTPHPAPRTRRARTAAPPRRQRCRTCSRTVEPVDTSRVQAGPGVIPAATTGHPRLLW